jgi:antirestriction protein ArdC
MPKRSSAEIYEAITERIIALLEKGVESGSWSKPWAMAANGGLPFNVASKRNYRGVNVLMLWAMALDEGYPTNEWATYNQWRKLGAQVRGPENGVRQKGTRVILFKKVRVKDADSEDEDGKRQVLIIKEWSVFNAAQVDGWTTPEPPELEIPLDEQIEGWVEQTGAQITYNHGETAAYIPARDRISIPKPELFKTPEAFHSVRFHELTHWTGAPARLDRQLTTRFGSEAYAAEELIAELGAAFACGMFGMEPVSREDHVRYLDHWLGILRADSKAIVTAASKAADAVDHLDQLAREGALAVEVV